MTEKLYYSDSHMRAFSAAVVSCEKSGQSCQIILDRTAFFPEGGGQLADTGKIGEAIVMDVQEKCGEIVHYTDKPLKCGESYHCTIDWEKRFQRMQSHSGEHIISGIIHSKFGYNNVGFHLGSDGITIDVDGELTEKDISAVELEANEAVYKNVRVTTSFPSPEELKTLDYRSKLELIENVRIVEIEGYDRCACCAPHVSQTGEIGIIKITDFMRHRGGMRIQALCGREAFMNFAVNQKSVTEISGILSSKRTAVTDAVVRMNDELQKLKMQNIEIKRSILADTVKNTEKTSGNLCFFEPSMFDSDSLRFLVNETIEKCDGVSAAFSGDDSTGYNYVIGSTNIDLHILAKEINLALSGRGGGSTEMIQGKVTERRSTIEKYFSYKGER